MPEERRWQRSRILKSVSIPFDFVKPGTQGKWVVRNHGPGREREKELEVIPGQIVSISIDQFAKYHRGQIVADADSETDQIEQKMIIEEHKRFATEVMGVPDGDDDE